MGERRFSTKNRFVSFLLAIAMVLTLLPIGAVQAKAEGSTITASFPVMILRTAGSRLEIGRLFIRK